MIEDPHHAIIDQPWKYEIIEFCFSRNLDDWRSAHLDLTLQRDSTIRRLRFLGAQSISIEEGFPIRTSGVCILDVSRRQLDGLSVHVTDFEASQGKIEFWASEVIDRDEDDKC
jgi:hypothetical protein